MVVLRVADAHDFVFGERHGFQRGAQAGSFVDSGGQHHHRGLIEYHLHLEAKIAFRDVDPGEYAGLFISGGRAPEYLRYDQDLLRITRHFFETKKPVASVCHGIEILTAAGVIKGRKVTTVAKCALDCEQGGARYVDEPCVRDGNLVTARTWHDNTPFMKAFVEMLKSAR